MTRISDIQLLNLVAALLVDALEEGYAKGRSGWQYSDCTQEGLQEACERSLQEGEWNKVICYATMIVGKKIINGEIPAP